MNDEAHFDLNGFIKKQNSRLENGKPKINMNDLFTLVE